MPSASYRTIYSKGTQSSFWASKANSWFLATQMSVMTVLMTKNLLLLGVILKHSEMWKSLVDSRRRHGVKLFKAPLCISDVYKLNWCHNQCTKRKNQIKTFPTIGNSEFCNSELQRDFYKFPPPPKKKPSQPWW